MLKLLLQLFGRICALAPEPLLRALVPVLGEVVLLIPSRRYTVYSNLSHVFPGMSRAEHRRIARASSRSLIETGLLSLAAPYLGADRLRQIVQAAPSLQTALAEHRANPFPMVMASAHVAYWEIQTCMPLLVPEPFPEIVVVYRPVDNPILDDWIKRTRERFGMRLLSRKQGFQEALKILRRQGIVGLHFDQNSGRQGALTTLFGRVCSTTELPGLFSEKYGARIYTIYPERLGFWRIALQMEPITSDGSVAGVTIALNRWLERKLQDDDTFCTTWLWSHDRWKNQDIPEKRLQLAAKRDLLAADLAARGLAQPLRHTRLWIRLPNWLGDVMMVLPLLRAIQRSRPDAEITLLAQPAFHPLLNRWQIADRIEGLPAKGWAYYRHFWRLRRRYPDCHILFTNSVRGDIEAWLTRCRQRFGLQRPGQTRPLLSHRYRVPADFDESAHHQLELWTHFLQHFGLNEPPDLSPLGERPEPASFVIGLVPGSENNPEKRWPIPHWCSLIAQLPVAANVVLFGTRNDRAITDEIEGRSARPLLNLAGLTSLAEYCDRLCACTVLVTNDTGGMHLANALGVPLVALFGPTNPVRTRPVFAAPFRVLQPPGCPPQGGAKLDDLQPAQVLAALRELAPDRFGSQ